jgi:hypothetical protein
MKGTKYSAMAIRNPETGNPMLLLDRRASLALRIPRGRKKLSARARKDVPCI